MPIYPVQVSVVINVSASKPTTQGGAKDVVTEKDQKKQKTKSNSS